MKRTVRLFGRSIPLWVLIVIPTAVALAAFIGRLLITGGVSGTAASQSGTSWDLESVSCTPLGGGTATCIRVDTASFTVALAGQSNTSSLEVRVNARNRSTDGSSGCWTARPTWAFGSSGDVAAPPVGSAQPGDVITPGNDAFFNTLLGFGNITPGQSLAATLQYQFEDAGDLAGSC